jgi:hypothetical protein
MSLLRKGANPGVVDYVGRSAIFYCVENNDLESVQALVECDKRIIKKPDNVIACI